MNIKNKSDLADFPDGGRATLVRRYSPALTKQQLDILISCPYARPACLASASLYHWLRPARALVRMGLLEEEPDALGTFRVTGAGAEVVHRWRFGGWAP